MSDSYMNSLPELAMSEEEQALLTGKLYEELKRQVGKYNSIDSTSIQIEKAQDILECLIYTVWATVEAGASKEELLTGNISELIEQGREILRTKQKYMKVAWELLCDDLPKVQNVYYRSTIENIGMFFKNYSIPYEAHHIPCSIDYWPLCPVSERLKGVHFIDEYLYRIQIENDFLNCFDEMQVRALYRKFIPHFEDALFNLCDPVLTNAIGRMLLGKQIQDLQISTEEQSSLLGTLTGKSIDELASMVARAIECICKEIGFEADEQQYLQLAVKGLPVRIAEAVKKQNLEYIFINFEY